MVRTDAHQLREVAGDSALAEGIKVVARTLWVPETVHRACDLLLHVRQEPGMIHRWRFG
jgi:hypothetical protein